MHYFLEFSFPQISSQANRQKTMQKKKRKENRLSIIRDIHVQPNKTIQFGYEMFLNDVGKRHYNAYEVKTFCSFTIRQHKLCTYHYFFFFILSFSLPSISRIPKRGKEKNYLKQSKPPQVHWLHGVFRRSRNLFSHKNFSIRLRAMLVIANKAQ